MQLDRQLLSSLPLHTFTRVDEGVLVYLSREIIGTVEIFTEDYVIEEQSGLTASELTLGKGGIHLGFIFHVPNITHYAGNFVCVAKEMSVNQIIESETTLTLTLPNIYVYRNTEGCSLLVSTKNPHTEEYTKAL